ncbi:uncharacterized protein PHALS_14345 [Plasmopara halstedii]|uniref:Uncharacterized protein n=1 Tax=Plasmopara halstedii TaxID=4781 RepID=A0A0P1ASJ7_PLAHL|nr:uncharacterized protein PHALS_14345 [Plasmopara halstedii]CEG44077.1 hypothetical protein PHALS_14345 [Plasmopara halstedii]|eukprot:XP_024580446.1 hypothetical protein PHALS_14345 [Plasmopara halstedii]
MYTRKQLTLQQRAIAGFLSRNTPMDVISRRSFQEYAYGNVWIALATGPRVNAIDARAKFSMSRCTRILHLLDRCELIFA